MTRSHLVPASQTKDIRLPFNGLYNSYLGELLDMDLECHTDDMSLEDGTAVHDYIYELDLKPYHKALTDGYAQFLLDTISDEQGLNITIDNIEYVPMNGQNRGDTLHACVNVNTLPAIDVNELQPYSTDTLTSYDGFYSFYDPDMTPLKDARYENWQDVYISFIIEYLANECEDIEQAYIESLSCNSGGAIELLMNNIRKEQCDKLNELLYSEGD